MQANGIAFVAQQSQQLIGAGTRAVIGIIDANLFYAQRIQLLKHQTVTGRIGERRSTYSCKVLSDPVALFRHRSAATHRAASQ
jgi:hypothetical protein